MTYNKQLYNINNQETMNKIADFTFHKSFVANNYMFIPLDDPFHHLLPP